MPTKLFNTILILTMGAVVLALIGRGIYHMQNTLTIPRILSSSSSGQTKKIMVQNGIEQEMLEYKHWTGTYEPTTFVLSINGKEIQPGTEERVTIQDNILNVRFDYAFLNGKRSGAKIISFEIDNNTSKLDITFEWKDKWQVFIENATPVKKEKTKFNTELMQE